MAPPSTVRRRGSYLSAKVMEGGAFLKRMDLSGAFSNSFVIDKSPLTRLNELQRRLLEKAIETPAATPFSPFASHSGARNGHSRTGGCSA